MAIFKYMGVIGAEKFFDKLTVRITEPHKYNDPFELRVNFKSKNILSYGRSKIESVVLHSIKNSLKRYVIDSDKIEFYQHDIDKNILEEICEKVGTTCFTISKETKPVNVLMWAHYADCHRGIAIEFNENSDVIKYSSPVTYASRRPIYDAKALDDLDSVSLSELYVKSSEWKYENEIRLAQRLEDCELENGIYVTNIPIDSISKVFIGVNADYKLKELALNFHKKTNIPIIFTKISETDFSFEVTQLYEK